MPTQPRLTDELLHQIEHAPTPESFLGPGLYAHRDLPGYLAEMLAAKGLKKAAVIRKAGINEAFGYQIFSGDRGAGRDKVLALGLAMGFSLHELRCLLNHANVGDLYSKNRRDAIIIFCVSHGFSLQQADEELYRFGEATISDGGDDNG